MIDIAIAISVPDHAQTASGISGMLVHAVFHWDMARFGEDRAWRFQRSRSEFEGQVAGRLARMDAA